MRNVNFSFFAILTIALVFASCEEESIDLNNPPDITAEQDKVNIFIDVEYFNSVTAKVSSKIIEENSTTISRFGVVYSNNEMPTLEDNIVDHSSDWRNYETTFEDLIQDTTYYMRSFVVISQGVVYSNQVEFKTLSHEGPCEDVPENFFPINLLDLNVSFDEEESVDGIYAIRVFGGFTPYFVMNLLFNEEPQTGQYYVGNYFPNNFSSKYLSDISGMFGGTNYSALSNQFFYLTNNDDNIRIEFCEFEFSLLGASPIDFTLVLEK